MERAAASSFLICKIRMKLLFVCSQSHLTCVRTCCLCFSSEAAEFKRRCREAFDRSSFVRKHPSSLGLELVLACISLPAQSVTQNSRAQWSCFSGAHCILTFLLPLRTRYKGSVWWWCQWSGGGELKKKNNKAKTETLNLQCRFVHFSQTTRDWNVYCSGECMSGVQVLTTSAAAAGSHEFKGALTGRGGAKALGGLNRAPNYEGAFDE